MKELILNTAINHLKKSPVLQGAVAAANSYMDKLNENLVHEKVDLEQLLSKLSPATDNLIVGFQRDESLSFVGGELVASLLQSQVDNFNLHLKMYFKSKDEKIILKEISKMLPVSILSDKSVIDLRSKDSVVFEVNPPSV